MKDVMGFLHSLFDISFEELITLKIIKFLYVLGIIFSGISAFYLIIEGFAHSFFTGFLALIFSPIVFILYVILSRVLLEIIRAIFKIADNTDLLKDEHKQK